jgi:hypothetical protein
VLKDVASREPPINLSGSQIPQLPRPEVRKHVPLAQMAICVTCRLVAATQAVLKPVLNRLADRIAVPREDHTILTVAEQVVQLRVCLGLGSTVAVPYEPLPSPVIAHGRCRDPTLTALIPMQAAVTTSTTTTHAIPDSKLATYSASADTGTRRRRPCLTVRS